MRLAGPTPGHRLPARGGAGQARLRAPPSTRPDPTAPAGRRAPRRRPGRWRAASTQRNIALSANFCSDPRQTPDLTPPWLPLSARYKRPASGHDRTEVGPVQTITVGPDQTIILSSERRLALAPARRPE